MKFLAILFIFTSFSVFPMYLGEETCVHHTAQPNNQWAVNFAEANYSKQALKAFHQNVNADSAFVRCCLVSSNYHDIQINVPNHLTLGESINHIELRTPLVDVSAELLQRIQNVINGANTPHKIDQLNVALNTQLNGAFIFPGNQAYPSMIRDLVTAINNGGYDMFLSRLLFVIKNNGLVPVLANIQNGTQYIVLHVRLENRVSKNMKEVLLNSVTNNLLPNVFYNSFREQLSLAGHGNVPSITVVSYSSII